jgi:hypothetical protein
MGQETITYHNRSPDKLETLVVHLRQNVNAKGVVRRPNLQVTGGMNLGEVSVQGQSLIERDTRSEVGYTLTNTVMRIHPPEPVLPETSVDLAFSWRYTLRSEGHRPRQGTDGEVYYMRYWYPQMAVYDDVQGWNTDPFQHYFTSQKGSSTRHFRKIAILHLDLYGIVAEQLSQREPIDSLLTEAKSLGSSLQPIRIFRGHGYLILLLLEVIKGAVINTSLTGPQLLSHL